jgi:succinate dehydrogenase / fumarate reductase membrane anchor subunit
MSKHKKISTSIKSGSGHWILQRVSAIALIPLVIWLVLSSLHIAKDPTYMSIFFAYPFNTIAAILFVGFSLYHGSVGLQVVFEDYISNKGKRFFYIILINLISIVTFVATLVAVLRLHLVG